jgi:sugar O-acyltransferase (sialic acid O-acetyltransferase NeuD family)
MIKRLAFIGATAYPETFHIIRDLNSKRLTYEVIGLLDDNISLKNRRIGGIEVIGGLDLAKTMPSDVQFVFGIGSQRTRIIRHEIIRRIGIPDHRYETLIHPSASILLDVEIGPGCIIHPGVIVGQESVLEGFNLVFTNTIVASRNHLGKFSMLTSLVSLTNKVRIGRSAFIGTASAVAEGVSIGAGAMIAMGSLVNKDVPIGVNAMGNPIRFFQKDPVPEELLEGLA